MCCVPSLRGRRRQEIERWQDLEIPWHACLCSVSLRIGKRAASMLLGLIDDLSYDADLHQPRETEGATRHVLNQTLDARLIARRQKHRLINANFSAESNIEFCRQLKILLYPVDG